MLHETLPQHKFFLSRQVLVRDRSNDLLRATDSLLGINTSKVDSIGTSFLQETIPITSRE